MSTPTATSSRPASFLSPFESSHIKKSSLLEKKDSFVHILQSDKVLKQTTLPLQRQATSDQALQASKEVMQAFYTQFLKMMFENLKGEDDDSLYQNEMLRGMLAENISKPLSQKITPMHEKIAGVMLKNGEKEDTPQSDDKFSRASNSLIATAA